MRPAILPPTLALAILVTLSTAGRGSHVVTSAPDVLRRVVPRVERVCGARFPAAPRVRELTSDAAMKLFAEDVRPELARRYRGATDGQMRYLMRVAASSSVRSCVARYSVTGKVIVLVRSGFDRQREALGLGEEEGAALLATALAHECVHALDDARFDLEALFRATADEEALRAVNMVAEGRAVHFGRAVAAELGVPAAIRNHLPGGASPEGAHEWRLALTYRHGLAFVESLIARGGVELADRALREPPAVTHLVCQPDRWPDGKRSKRMAALHRALVAFGKPNEATRMSELLMRVRYSALEAYGPETARRLFDPFRDGSQVVVERSNVAALEFADAKGAAAYAASCRDEPACLVWWEDGDRVVVRVSGPDRADVMPRVRRALAGLDR